MTLHGRRILVTGATGGLGPSVVEALLAVGGEVIACARRKTGVEALRAELHHHERLEAAECDVTDSAGLGALFDAVERSGPLDAVVHLVGAFHSGKLVETDDAAVETLISMNLRSTVNVLREAVRRMLPRGAGAIVVLGADRALEPAAGVAVYGAAKAGAVHLVSAVAAEVHGTGVRVNALLPGVIDTAGNRKAMPTADMSRWASPRAIARAAVWLVSSDSEGTNGSLLRIPGL